ncbi:hypothetical protein ACE7GA_21335 [Roseomonas sp. CCTCC AB2023176]|uniref:hypothetical protein n=1 Tax=Roseomonas sp. CCTCC AB2023176 TaxID=3342640 RepID=UPI0035DE41D7
MTDEGTAETRREAARRRSEEWRERRRRGEMVVSVTVGREAVWGLRRLGLIASGAERDHAAVADAAAHFVTLAPSIAAMGEALFPRGVTLPGDADGA